MISNLFITKSFQFPKHNFVYAELSKTNKPCINSRQFASPDKNIEEEIAGNLYSWINQSYSVLWQIDKEKNEIIIFNNTTQKLAERFATLLKITKEDASSGVKEMVESLGLANLFMEKIISQIGDNQHLKSKTETLTGSLKLYLFWLASKELKESELGQKCLQLFMRKFALEINLEEYEDYSDEEMINALRECIITN